MAWSATRLSLEPGHRAQLRPRAPQIQSQPAVKPYLWQRGLALYYADRFVDGAEQFAADVYAAPRPRPEE